MAIGVGRAELKKHYEKLKKKPAKKEIHHMTIEKMDNGGFVTESHTHGKDESCKYGDTECSGKSMAHKDHKGMMKHVKEAFGSESGSTQEEGESLQHEGKGKAEEEFD